MKTLHLLLISIGGVILATVLGVGIYLYLQYRKYNPILIHHQTSARHGHKFSRSELPLTSYDGGLEYSFNFWIFIESMDYRYGEEKIILFWKGKNIADVLPSAVTKCKKPQDFYATPSIKKDSQKLMEIKESCPFCKDASPLEGFQNYTEIDPRSSGTIEDFTNSGAICPKDHPIPYDGGGVPNSWCCSGSTSSSGTHGDMNDVCESGKSVACAKTPCTPWDARNEVTVGSYSGVIVSLASKTNSLLVKQSLLNGKTDILEIPHLPLQKWLHLVVILKEHYIDVFVNGKLMASKSLTSIPVYNSARLSVNPGGGFGGFISRLQYHNRAITIQEVRHRFKRGPPTEMTPPDEVK